MYAEGKRNQPKVRAFRDWLLEEIRTSLRDDPWALWCRRSVEIGGRGAPRPACAQKRTPMPVSS